ncbi:alpha-tubulin N-acetyltransferase-like isoform X2 [Actinia tenebrosa]|nr:alpha-tubulin N-acetyltransferase-like isoform X2 [Actinia tenebrosa]
MEFPFNVNHVLPETVTLVDENFSPFREKFKHDRVLFNSKQKELKNIVDLMGEASAKAQNLKASITSAIKLATSDHRLYILKDPPANNGLGAVIGIIKIGHKKLFVLDYHGNQHEVNPLCVLDFYIHESKQRTGCGKILFEHMIKMEGIEPGQLAVDRPSHKFLSFLKKHYNLDKPIPQVNNFVVFAEFFRDLQAVGLVSRRHQRFSVNNPKDCPPLYPYKRPVDNDSLLPKRQAVSRQSPTNLPSSSRKEVPVTSRQATNEFNTSQPMDIDNTRRSSGEAMATGTSRNSQGNDEFLKEMDVKLPPLAPRPPGRHSASRSQVGSAGSRWILESS